MQFLKNDLLNETGQLATIEDLPGQVYDTTFQKYFPDTTPQQLKSSLINCQSAILNECPGGLCRAGVGAVSVFSDMIGALDDLLTGAGTPAGFEGIGEQVHNFFWQHEVKHLIEICQAGAVFCLDLSLLNKPAETVLLECSQVLSIFKVLFTEAYNMTFNFQRCAA